MLGQSSRLPGALSFDDDRCSPRAVQHVESRTLEIWHMTVREASSWALVYPSLIRNSCLPLLLPRLTRINSCFTAAFASSNDTASGELLAAQAQPGLQGAPTIRIVCTSPAQVKQTGCQAVQAV